MTRTTNIATNPFRSLRTAFFTMMACAMALVGPQTYATNCATEEDAFRTAFADYNEAADTLADAEANWRAAQASGNAVWNWLAMHYWIFSKALYDIALNHASATLDTYVDCLIANGE